MAGLSSSSKIEACMHANDDCLRGVRNDACTIGYDIRDTRILYGPRLPSSDRQSDGGITVGLRNSQKNCRRIFSCLLLQLMFCSCLCF